jgi:uncharacterized OB-fold protein
MVWTLISYSEIQVPLPPFEPNYLVGLVEDDDKQRLIVQVAIDKRNSKEIRIGVTGEVKRVELREGSLNVFVPNL